MPRCWRVSRFTFLDRKRVDVPCRRIAVEVDISVLNGDI